VELGQENAKMAPLLDQGLKHGWLVHKVILLAQYSSHTAILTLKRANWLAFSPLELLGVPSPFLENSLQAFGLTTAIGHFLNFASFAGSGGMRRRTSSRGIIDRVHIQRLKVPRSCIQGQSLLTPKAFLPLGMTQSLSCFSSVAWTLLILLSSCYEAVEPAYCK
jgi:hypothetical protein